jgi:hypothetical protein
MCKSLGRRVPKWLKSEMPAFEWAGARHPSDYSWGMAAFSLAEKKYGDDTYRMAVRLNFKFLAALEEYS